MYGTHKSVISKLEGDIQSVKEKILDKNIAEDKVRRLICCHTSSNITIKQKEDLEKMAEPYQLELIGINEIANDLRKLDFQYLAKEYLSISESTEQIWSINDFIRIHDESKTNAPISNDYIGDISEIINTIKSSEKRIFLISAKPGTGKTRLAIEICSLLDRNKYNIICVKSNNQDIYQDVKRNLNLHKENIIFIDDVNTTQNYISTLGLLNTNTNIRFILTVRDYAKKDIINNIKDYGYDNFVPTLLKDDNFKKLLSQFSQTEFTRKEIEHIKTISKSNPRIAVIAAKLSSSQDLINFNDEIDILKDYYEEILNKNNIIYAEQNTLFILSYLKKIRLESLEENQEFNKLLKITDITNTDFKSAVEKLHERELCNIYNDKIVKIADQSLDDYIVIKFLVNQKISILEVLHELYPVNGQRVVQILNQCSNFIRKESDLEGVSDAVKSYYNENNFESDELKEKFLIQFGVLLPLEAISHVKNKIDNIEPQAYTKTNFINQKDKKESIEDSVLNIVFVTTRTKYCSQILQLLLKYFDKNPNKISEVYSILEANYGLVTEREYIDYTLAENTISELANLDLTKSYNQELIVTILKQYLKIEIERTEAHEETFTFGRYKVPDSEKLKQYHRSILKLLATLYNIGSYETRFYIEKMLYDYRIKILTYSESHCNTILGDLRNIRKLFFNDIKNLSMIGEKIVYALHKAEVEKNLPSVFDDYMISERQDIYINLTNRNHAWFYKDNVEIRLQQIADTYSSNLQNIFNFANQFKNSLFMNDINIELVLFNMFLLLKNDNKIEFLNSMFESNYHFESRTPISFLENIEKSSMQSVIASSPESEKYEWQLAYLTQLEKVKNEDLQTLKSILEANSLPCYFTILNFERLILKDPSLKELLIQKAVNNNFVIFDFIREEEVPKLINLIGENDLKSQYLINLGSSKDHTYKLFQKLGENDINFAVEVLKKIDELKMGRSNLGYMVLHTINGFRDKKEIYKKFIRFAINRPYYYYNNMLDDILKNDSQIILEMLEATNNEQFAIRLVNLGVEVIEDSKQRLLLFKLLKSKEFGKKSFQEIHFSPYSYLFTGSHVPVLELEKELLEKIKEIFEDDIDYINLLIYLDKLIDGKRKAIERELEKEF
ncbi:type III restriction enzyme, res subunit domain protein [Streptococcus sp. oral taxon 056 str. F0418]|nr:type III restriction enzyme, res subunit domain protein [Streptococcus sp. oral taxon 056 str. F0418]